MSAKGASKRNPNDVEDKLCNICGKYFDRRDVLKRHLQIHDIDRPPPRPRKTACAACVRSKVKCLGERPACSRCTKRHVLCLYDQDVIGAPSIYHESSPGAFANPGNRLNSESQISHEPRNTDQPFIPQSPQESYQQNLNNGLLSQFMSVNLSAQLMDTDLYSHMDWVFSSDFDNPSLYSMQTLPLDRTYLSIDRPTDSASEPANGQQPSIQQPNTDARPSMCQLRYPTPQEVASTEEKWPPIEWQDSHHQLRSLPFLGNDEQLVYPNHFSLPQITESTLKDLKDSLRVPSERGPWQPVSLDTFPTKETFEHFVDLYFVHFDKFFPLVHRPSFDPTKDLVLTLAIGAIGACYSAFGAARAFGTSLSELTRRLLIFMAEYDPKLARSEAHVTAQLLQSVHGLSCGDRRLYELGDCNLNSIINNARGMRLFEYHKPTYTPGHTLQEKWEAWIRFEKSQRLGWAVYAFDTSVLHYRYSRPLLALTEIKMDLPCDTAHWEAASPQAWAALHPWTDQAPSNLPFRSTFDSLFDSTGHTICKITDEYQRLLILGTLARICWGMKESLFEPGSTFLPTYPLIPESQTMLLSIVSQFFRPVTLHTKQLPQLDLQTRVEQLYLLLGIRTTLADDVLGFMYRIWARGPRFEEYYQRLAQWAARQPVKARILIHVGAQCLSIARQFPYNHPLEPYNAFHGGLVLWTMASLPLSSPPGASPLSSNSMNGRPTPAARMVCHLDWLGEEDSPEAQAVRDWIQYGGDFVLRMHGIPNLGTERGLQQVLEQTADVLRRMPVWGIAQKFLNAILRLLHTGRGTPVDVML